MCLFFLPKAYVLIFEQQRLYFLNCHVLIKMSVPEKIEKGQVSVNRWGVSHESLNKLYANVMKI